MPIKSLLSEMSVDVTKTEMICKAFDDAWAHLKNADDTLADPSKASVIRTALARRIIEMARQRNLRYCDLSWGGAKASRNTSLRNGDKRRSHRAGLGNLHRTISGISA